MRYARGCTRERKTWRTPFKKKDKEGERGRQREDRDENRQEEERMRARYGEGCGSGPLIISGDWPTGPTTAATWLDERTLHQVRKTHLRETMPPRRLGVVKLSWGGAIMGLPMVLTSGYEHLLPFLNAFAVR